VSNNQPLITIVIQCILLLLFPLEVYRTLSKDIAKVDELAVVVDDDDNDNQTSLGICSTV
jgi:hypothetical protein